MDRTFAILSSYQKLHNQAVSLFDIMHVIDDDHKDAQVFRSMIIISLHTSLEVLFKDIISNYIQNHPDSIEIEKIAKISVKVSSIQSGTIYSDIVLELKNSAPKNLNSLLKYRSIIEDTLCLSVLDVPKEDIQLIAEFSALRNIIVHNNRKVDPDYLRNVPWSKSQTIGKEMTISASEYVQMINAIFSLVNNTVLTAFLPPPYSFNLKGIDFDEFEGVNPYNTHEMRRRYREWYVKKARQYGTLLSVPGTIKGNLIDRLMSGKERHDF